MVMVSDIVCYARLQVDSTGHKDRPRQKERFMPFDLLTKCRIPDDHMVACETDAGVSDTTLSSPAWAYCS